MSPEARLRSTTALGGCVLSGVLALAVYTWHSLGEGYPFARLQGTPMMVFCGTADAPNLGRSRDMVTALQQNGVPAVLREYAGATHDSAPSAATPDIFTFFAANGRK